MTLAPNSNAGPEICARRFRLIRVQGSGKMAIDAGKKVREKAAKGLRTVKGEYHSANMPSFPTTVLSDSYPAVHACSRC